jgi:hypothetical protein
MNSVETLAKHSEPVDSRAFSTGWTHRANVLFLRERAVFPVVHTPYDFYERI